MQRTWFRVSYTPVFDGTENLPYSKKEATSNYKIYINDRYAHGITCLQKKIYTSNKFKKTKLGRKTVCCSRILCLCSTHYCVQRDKLQKRNRGLRNTIAQVDSLPAWSHKLLTVHTSFQLCSINRKICILVNCLQKATCRWIACRGTHSQLLWEAF